MTKGETLNSCDVTFQIYCNDIFFVKMINNSIQQNKNFILKKAGNWAGFTLQTIYLVDILLFLHDVLIIMYTVLQFGICFEPKCSKSSIFYNLMIRLGSTYDSG